MIMQSIFIKQFFVFCVHPMSLVCVWEQQILNETLHGLS